MKADEIDSSVSQRVPLWLALIPVIVLVGSLAVTVMVYEMKMAHQALIVSTAVAVLVSHFLGVSWQQSLEGMIRAIGMALPACLILMIVGVLIGTWILAGVVPTLIVYGLDLLAPQFFLAATCVVCAVISLATGSSWSTAGTVGVALIGVGAGLQIPAPMTAGAIISGAYFGDKLSPLSDTTNLAPAVAGTELFVHIKHMLYTTVPSLTLALVAYLVLGLFLDTGSVSATRVARVVDTLQTHHFIHPVMLFPPLAVIAMVVGRVPALPALFIGCVLGGVFAWGFGGHGLEAILDAAQTGYVSKTGMKEVDALLSRGGLEKMMNTVALILCALSFGGAMETGGLLQRLSRAVLSVVRGTGSLVLATLFSCLGMNVLGGEQYMAIVIPGRMYRPAFTKMGLHPKNLSRCLEDAGTLTSSLVPWNSCGAYMYATLGVSPLLYLPYAFLNLLNPAISAFYGFTGITMEPANEAQEEKTQAGEQHQGQQHEQGEAKS
jgi:NhaC family Na+:H+ antiporter